MAIELNGGDLAIIRQIVSRCHVGDTLEDVQTYAQSRMQKAAWRKLSGEAKAAFRNCVQDCHAQNRWTYNEVMRG